MEFRYFFSIVFVVAVSIGVFGNIELEPTSQVIASAETATPNPHN